MASKSKSQAGKYKFCRGCPSSSAIALLFVFLSIMPAHAQFIAKTPQGQIYYVSSSEGSDSASGLSQSTPIASIARLNSLELLPGDQVHFHCGDTWRAEPLRITQSGLENNPIIFSSYPDENCASKPRLSGAQPLIGWTLHEPNIYSTSLESLANRDRFPAITIEGINQLFRNSTRLTSGRWPNLNSPNGGFASIDAQTSPTSITDSDLPTANWGWSKYSYKGCAGILNRQSREEMLEV